MLRYIIRRLSFLLPIFLGVSVIVFTIMHLAPGDPVLNLIGQDPDAPEHYALLRKKLGLDQPIYVQYLRYLGRFFRGDLGRSIVSRNPVAREILIRLPRTMKLAVASLILAVVIAIPAGVISATKQNSIIDNLIMVGSVTAISIPSFWLGIMLLYIFSFRLGLTPMSGMGGIEYLILPALSLGTRSVGSIARLTRSSMLEILRQDYIRTARSKGLSERIVIYKHALQNALMPVLTVIGLRFGTLLGGAFITETIFAWPGIGMLALKAIREYDYPVVQGTLLVVTFSYVLCNLLVDILYAYIDPRVQYE